MTEWEILTWSIMFGCSGNVKPPFRIRHKSSPPHFFQEHTQPVPVYHPTPGESRLASQLTEEEQVRIAQRIGLIQHLPKGIFDPGSDPSEKKVKEWALNGGSVISEHETYHILVFNF